MKNNKLKVILALCVVVLIFAVLILNSAGNDENGKFDEFAKCLASKGITMYGAEWCSHCKDEKRAFGNSFKYVPYVECPDEPQKCIDAGIRGYPTWIFPAPIDATSSADFSQNGKKLEGKQGLEKLSQESGCALPL